MIISYPANPSRIIVLLKTLRHIIENLKKKVKERNAALKKTERKHFSINCNKHCFQKLHVDVQAEESDLKTSVPRANLIKMKTQFQFILMNWNITSTKIVRNSILEG